MNNYIKNLFDDRMGAIDGSDLDDLNSEAELMSSLNIKSNKDFKDLHYILMYVEPIAEELSGKEIDKEEISKISSIVYLNREKYPLDNLTNFYKSISEALNKINISVKKIAYPQGDNGKHLQPQHNMAKWLKAMKAIYFHVNQGVNKEYAINLLTDKWDKMEKLDFKNWLKFYEENAHNKYNKHKMAKVAQKYIEIGNGALLPIDRNDLRAHIPGVPSYIQEPDMSRYNNEQLQQERRKQEEIRKSEEEEEIKKQLKALIGRLNAAERIATTKGIDKLLGPAYETWLKALHDLKREIQVSPFRNIRSSLLSDLIVRKGNQLASSGHSVPAKIMYKLAQVAPPPLEKKEDGLDLENMTDAGLDKMPSIPKYFSEPSTEKENEWAQEFLFALKGLDSDENEEVLESDDNNLNISENDLVVKAQSVPLQQKKETLHLTDIDSALDNVTMQDAITRLEKIRNVYQTREISHQLSLVDTMLDRLGLAPFFPELAEATQKSLDANQYCLTRVEDVLSRLRGSFSDKILGDFDLEGERVSPAAEGALEVRKALEDEERKDDEKRKSKEEAADLKERNEQINNEQAQTSNVQPEVAKEPPQISTKELNQPTNIQRPGPGIRI